MKKQALCLILSSCIIFSGCATIVSSKRQAVRVDFSTTTSALKFQGRELKNGDVINVSRGEKPALTEVKDDGSEVDHYLDKKLDHNVWLNGLLLILGVLPGGIGLGIDFATGNAYKFREEQKITLSGAPILESEEERDNRKIAAIQRLTDNMNTRTQQGMGNLQQGAAIASGGMTVNPGAQVPQNNPATQQYPNASQPSVSASESQKQSELYQSILSAYTAFPVGTKEKVRARAIMLGAVTDTTKEDEASFLLQLSKTDQTIERTKLLKMLLTQIENGSVLQ